MWITAMLFLVVFVLCCIGCELTDITKELKKLNETMENDK